MSDVGSKSLGRPLLYALILLGLYLSYLVLSPFFVAQKDVAFSTDVSET
jgi:hypothetical protein